jgi:hypothetical protein
MIFTALGANVELIVWCSQAVICFFAWNRLTEILQSKWKLSRSQYYLVAGVFVFASTQIATSVFLLIAGVLLIASAWLKDRIPKIPLVANTVAFMAVFVTGFEWLMRQTSMLTQMTEAPAWVFWLTENYLHGLLMGLLIGAVISIVSRHPAHGLWIALNFQLAGIVSLSGAWGIVLGDFLIIALMRPRSWGAVVVVFVASLLTPWIQPLAETWMMGELALMFAFLVALDFVTSYLVALFYGKGRSGSAQAN